MKNHFAQFTNPRLGQSDAAPSFYATFISPHLWWILGSSILSSYITWKVCKAYTSGHLLQWLSSKPKKKLKRNPEEVEKVETTNAVAKPRRKRKRNPSKHS